MKEQTGQLTAVLPVNDNKSTLVSLAIKFLREKKRMKIYDKGSFNKINIHLDVFRKN